MPFLHFVSEELVEEFEKNPRTNNKEQIFPEHDFLLSALNIGFRIEDLKHLTFVDVVKVFLCYVSNQKRTEEENEREATQQDIDSFF